MSKKTGIIVMAIGAVLIISALLLFAYNQYEDYLAGQEAESLLSEVEAAIETQPTKPTLDPELPTKKLNGYDYVGYIEVPVLDLKLPVMADWDYNRLQISPCRQLGSSRTDDLVIAAHNYSKHFGRLKTLNKGDSVIFTDMEGIVNNYSVEKVDTVNPYDVDTVLNSEYDLVLYTCTPGGRTRVTVFCSRTEE